MPPPIRHPIAIAMLVLALLTGCDPPDVGVATGPIMIADEVDGQGPIAARGDVVTIDYRLSLPDGKLLLHDNAFRFVLGAGAVIRCVDEVVEGMQPGGRRIVECPPHEHWGADGYGDGVIPPHTPVVLDVRLVGIERLEDSH